MDNSMESNVALQWFDLYMHSSLGDSISIINPFDYHHKQNQHLHQRDWPTQIWFDFQIFNPWKCGWNEFCTADDIPLSNRTASDLLYYAVSDKWWSDIDVHCFQSAVRHTHII